MIINYEKFMEEALKQAQIAAEENEVPVGAVVVCDNKIVSVGRNFREKSLNALAHAEIEAINEACKKLGRWRLNDCDIYVTLEPCPMCAGAIINARFSKLIFGAFDEKAGSCGTLVDLTKLPYNHKLEVISGVLQEECVDILKNFFKKLRKKDNDTCKKQNFFENVSK